MRRRSSPVRRRNKRRLNGFFDYFRSRPVRQVSGGFPQTGYNDRYFEEELDITDPLETPEEYEDRIERGAREELERMQKNIDARERIRNYMKYGKHKTDEELMRDEQLKYKIPVRGVKGTDFGKMQEARHKHEEQLQIHEAIRQREEVISRMEQENAQLQRELRFSAME